MSFRELCKPYLKDGVMLDRNKILDGNALLYTGTMYVLMHRLDELREGDLDDFRSLYMSSDVSVEPGLIVRFKKPDDWQAHDDYRGLLGASYFLEHKRGKNLTFARYVHNYGKKNWYCWNNLNPGKWIAKGFFVRLPGFWALTKACAGRKLNLFDKIMFSVNILSTLYKDDGFSGYNMDWIDIQVLKDHNYWLTNKAIAYYEKKFMERYPDGMGHAYSSFFNEQYPFAIAMKGKM